MSHLLKSWTNFLSIVIAHQLNWIELNEKTEKTKTILIYTKHPPKATTQMIFLYHTKREKHAESDFYASGNIKWWYFLNIDEFHKGWQFKEINRSEREIVKTRGCQISRVNNLILYSHQWSAKKFHKMMIPWDFLFCCWHELFYIFANEGAFDFMTAFQ